MQRGIFNLTSEIYHSDPCPTASLSSSIANILLDQSPLHAYLAHPRLNRLYQRESTSRFDLGSAAHMMLLERREDRIVRVQADDWRTKAAKEARDAAQADGKYAVLERQYADIVALCRAAQDYLNDTELADMLATGAAEQSCLWQSGPHWYRSRPDLISADRKVILDYKSTASAAPEFISRQLGRMGYDLQSEFYSWGHEVVTGIKPAFVFLFQEITPPYACSLVSLSNTFKEVGGLKLNRAVNIWEDCLETNNWYGYSNKILYAEPAPWEAAELQTDINTQETE